MDTLDRLNLYFRPGEALSSSDLNSMVSAINDINSAVNNLLSSFCDINQETGLQEVYTLGQAIRLVPENRRSFTMKIRFIEHIDYRGTAVRSVRFAEYFYTGPKEFDSSMWENENNWSRDVPSLIDGGIWGGNTNIFPITFPLEFTN